MNPATRQRLETLLSALIDEQLTREQADELDFLLRDDPRNRTFYVQYMDLQAALTLPSNGNEDDDTANDHAMDWQSVLETMSEMGRTSEHRQHQATRRDRIQSQAPWLVTAISLAAALYFAFASLVAPTGDLGEVTLKDDQNDVTQVLVASSAGAEFFRDIAPGVGETLEYEREYALTAGMMNLVFPCGASAILEAPCVVEIADPMRLIVKIGRCSVHAPDGAEGFQVDTPSNKIIDLGTRFSVDVDSIGSANVQVVEGAADVVAISREHPVGHGNAQRLTEKEAHRFDGMESEPLDFNARGYRAELPDRLISYRTKSATEPVSELASITVQRGGNEHTYPVDELVGIKVIHYRSSHTAFHIATDGIQPAANADSLATLESDYSLITGLINPGGSKTSLKESPILRDLTQTEDGVDDGTQGMGFRFVTPLVNDPGPDVVLFEVQNFVDTPDGDAFHISPLEFRPGLHSHTITRYDITTKSSEAKRVREFELHRAAPVTNLLNLTLDRDKGFRPPENFLSVATGIDLSDLGYELGDSVDGLFLQDAMENDLPIDPMLIAGLPPVSTKPDPKQHEESTP
ncbi:FecR family protein [Neorhodopirellula lusitana]|uniref:iron dicitrate transport regulator FecR n=1 Tax=Neorhodopirellula lusitana TaxID=445327 RepID=UPI00384FFABC